MKKNLQLPFAAQVASRLLLVVSIGEFERPFLKLQRVCFDFVRGAKLNCFVLSVNL